MHQQGNGTVAGDQDRLDRETTATALLSDRPVESDSSGAQSEDQVTEPAAGTSVRDEQTHTTTDTSDPANAVAEGHHRPGASVNPGVQSDTDIRQQGSGSTADDEDRHDKETVPTALLSDRPMVSNSPGSRSDINAYQQGNRTVLGDQERLDEETAVTASPGDHPTVVDSLGAPTQR